MKYTRVIPRDFFNEAKLLKCMGILSLKILDCQLPEGIEITISESGNPFNIQLSDDGSLYVANYQIKVNGQIVEFHTTYNSKSNYPFYASVDYCEYQVFDDGGEFTDEFIEQFKVPA
jgi:hypothetical protein